MKLKFLIVLIALSTTIACDSGSKKQSTIQTSENDIESIQSTETEKSSILADYYALKDALVASDSEKAKGNALTLALALKEEGIAGNLLILSEAISGAADIDDQRLEFEKLSREIYAMAKKSNFGEVVIYRQYCPMAFENKGAFWLSDDKEIMNPYFGDKMLHCGRIEETISN